MGGFPAGGAISVYQPINYLLFRVYEAGCQLRSASGRKVAVIVIDELAWYRFDPQIRKQWIDWSNPNFIASDAQWNYFLLQQEKRYPGLHANLHDIIRAIDSIQIFRQDWTFDFELAFDSSHA